jgi:hypothetical protein
LLLSMSRAQLSHQVLKMSSISSDAVMNMTSQ